MTSIRHHENYYLKVVQFIITWCCIPFNNLTSIWNQVSYSCSDEKQVSHEDKYDKPKVVITNMY